MFSSVSVCLLTELVKTTDQIIMKFSGHNPGTNRSDFGGNPDLDPNSGIFKEIYHWDIGNCKSSSSRIRQQSDKIRRLADLRLNKLKAALAEVSAACVFLFWFVVSNLLAP